MALRKLARDCGGLSRRSDTAFAHLWRPEPDQPERFGRYRTQGRRWSLLFGALLSGDIFLVPIRSHVRGVDQADVLMMGI